MSNFNLYNTSSEKIKYGEEGFYNPGSGNIPEHTVNNIRTGQPAVLTQEQQNKIDSPLNFKFNASFMLYLIAGVFVLGIAKSAVSGSFDVTKSLALFGIAAVCVIAAILVKNKDTSESALAIDGRREAYIHIVTDKHYFEKNHAPAVYRDCTYLITVAGEQFSVTRQVYDSLNVGDYVTCVISASGGMYYIDFTA